jgi:hypothetical protein
LIMFKDINEILHGAMPVGSPPEPPWLSHDRWQDNWRARRC